MALFQTSARSSSSSQAFTLLELVIVLLIMGILAAIAVPRAFDMTEDAQVATLQRSLYVIQLQIDGYFGDYGVYSETVDPTWFRGNKLPHHPMNDGSIPDLHIFTADDREHPSYKYLDKFGAYWYNRNVGIVRARVPRMKTTQEALDLYNTVNRSALTTIGQMYD